MKQMKSIRKRIILLILLVVFLSACDRSSDKSSDVQAPALVLDPIIEKRITEWGTPLQETIREESIYSAILVKSFYKERNYKPAWSQDGSLTQADTIIKSVEEAYGDGLTPDHYHLVPIKSLVNKAEISPVKDADLMADLDILLTDAFLTLGCHLSGGCVNPVTAEEEWFAKQGTVDVTSALEQALRKKQVRETLVMLRPEEGPYGRLKEALALYRELASKGEWPLVSGGMRLEKASVSDRVPELRARLAASGDLESVEAKTGNVFDEKLEQAVISFQNRHGLTADGIVGTATLDALNVPLKQRIRQIELNMERLRWILSNQEQRSIVVNLANFRLDVIEDLKPVLSMKVVVGKPFLRTPVFTARMNQIVINPSWNVPDSIVRKEILGKIKKNPQYLVEQNIKVLRGWGTKEEEIAPETIDWSKISPDNLPYRFRQEPGPLNPLGRLKFILPNKFDVYLHDTNARNLFSRDMRAFSHGCTRIEKPLELAEYLLQGDSDWNRERLLAAMDKGLEQKVILPHPLNVHFLYLTAWVDGEGILQFRKDIYGRDSILDKALQRKPSFK